MGWGHSGELPGYDVQTIFSEDGRRQVVLMINQNATTLPKRVITLLDRLLEKAYCAHGSDRDGREGEPLGGNQATRRRPRHVRDTAQ